MRNWLVRLDSSTFDWVSHASRFEGINLVVVDAGLEVQQRRQLKNVIDPATPFLGAHLLEGTVLYSLATDLFDPMEWFRLGDEQMVFAKWPSVEYYNLCKPLVSIVNQARTANYIEDQVGSRGGIAAPTRICGPTYLWKVMAGLTNFMSKSQTFFKPGWEQLIVNLFAAAYPDYTLLKEIS